MNTAIHQYKKEHWTLKNASNAPLIVFRLVFGALMIFSTLRFWINGWIEEFYIQPSFHFTYWGFDWLKPLPGDGMYLVFGLMVLAALGILLGFFYRVSSALFFLLFTYVELIDKTFYLNHYYFVSLVAFLMIFLPAHRRFSLDVYLGRVSKIATTKKLHIDILRYQIGIVYLFAGLAKINTDWLLEALPLKIWLPAHSYLPIIGNLMNEEWFAYLMSWGGMLFDISIFFLLMYKRTRIQAYLLVVFFHVFTWLLFPIGVFPWVMIGLTLIFFDQEFHERVLSRFPKLKSKRVKPINSAGTNALSTRAFMYGLSLFFVLQLVLPFRYLLYPENLFWHEQGYRFSWRVMLMEKAGACDFLVKDKTNSNSEVISLQDHLSDLQVKMMSTQPDMILQFAHYIDEIMIEKGWVDPKVYADCMVTLQGERSRPFVNSSFDLSEAPRGLENKTWILPFQLAKDE